MTISAFSIHDTAVTYFDGKGGRLGTVSAVFVPGESLDGFQKPEGRAWELFGTLDQLSGQIFSGRTPERWYGDLADLHEGQLARYLEEQLEGRVPPNLRGELSRTLLSQRVLPATDATAGAASLADVTAAKPAGAILGLSSHGDPVLLVCIPAGVLVWTFGREVGPVGSAAIRHALGRLMRVPGRPSVLELVAHGDARDGA